MRYERTPRHPCELMDASTSGFTMMQCFLRVALALTLALLTGYARAAESPPLPTAAAEALAAVRANLESQVRGNFETPAQLFQRSEVLWSNLQTNMRALGAAVGDLPARVGPPDSQLTLDAMIIDVARAYARAPATVETLLDRYGKTTPGSEQKAVMLSPRLLDEDVVPQQEQAWIMLLMSPRTQLSNFAYPRVMQAIVRLRVRNALPLLELRAVQDAADHQRLPRDLSAMRAINPAQALAIYARCIERSRDALTKQPKARVIYVQEIRSAVDQNPALAEIARTTATDAVDPLVREMFTEATSE